METHDTAVLDTVLTRYEQHNDSLKHLDKEKETFSRDFPPNRRMFGSLFVY